jgi:hypothetical protein
MMAPSKARRSPTVSTLLSLEFYIPHEHHPLQASKEGKAPWYPWSSSTADVDNRTPCKVRFSLPQDLVGDRGGVSLTEQYIAEHVYDGIALGPAEVAVRRLAGRVAQM